MATYYWVGGNGTWDNSSKTNWATSSGGAGGSGPPTNADTVNFDANSGTAATVTVASTAVSLSTTINKSDINLSLSGSPTLCTAAGTLTLTTGTITLNDNTLTAGAGAFSGTSTRTIAFGTGNITFTGNARTVLSMSTVTGLTITGTPVFNFTYSGATGSRAIGVGLISEASQPSLNISAGTDTLALSANTYYKTLNFNGFSGSINNTALNIYGNVVGSSGMTWTAGANTWSFISASAVQQITTAGKTLDFPLFVGTGTSTNTLQLQDNLTIGSTRSLSVSSGTIDLTGNSGNWTLSVGTFVSSNSNVRSIKFGTGNITVTGNAATVWSVANAANFSYTGTPTINATYSGSTGTRIVSHGNSGGGASTNAVSFNVSFGSDVVTLTSGIYAKNLIFTGFSGTLSNTVQNIYGDYTLATGMTLTAGTNATVFAGTSGAQQITTNNLTLDYPLTFNGIGGTFAFQDALTQGSTRAFTITNGTVQLKNGVTSTVGALATSGTNQKVLQSTSAGNQATLSQASGNFNAQYLTVKDIAATGGAKFNGLNNCITQGNNSGWYFAPQLGRPLPAFAF